MFSQIFNECVSKARYVIFQKHIQFIYKKYQNIIFRSNKKHKINVQPISIIFLTDFFIINFIILLKHIILNHRFQVRRKKNFAIVSIIN